MEEILRKQDGRNITEGGWEIDKERSMREILKKEDERQIKKGGDRLRKEYESNIKKGG